MQNPTTVFTSPSKHNPAPRRDRHGAFRRGADRRIDHLIRENNYVSPTSLIRLSPDTPKGLHDVAVAVLEARDDLVVEVRHSGARRYRLRDEASS